MNLAAEDGTRVDPLATPMLAVCAQHNEPCVILPDLPVDA